MINETQGDNNFAQVGAGDKTQEGSQADLIHFKHQIKQFAAQDQEMLLSDDGEDPTLAQTVESEPVINTSTIESMAEGQDQLVEEVQPLAPELSAEAQIYGGATDNPKVEVPEVVESETEVQTDPGRMSNIRESAPPHEPSGIPEEYS